MKQYFCRNQFKFAMLLSISSLIGSQESHGVAVYCPKAGDITEHAHKEHLYYKGTAKSTDDKITIPMESRLVYKKKDFSQSPPKAYLVRRNKINCVYGENEDIAPSLLSEDKIKENCKVVAHDGTPAAEPWGPGDHFECEEAR